MRSAGDPTAPPRAPGEGSHGEEIAGSSLVDLLAAPPRPQALLLTLGPLLIAWLGVNAVWGMTGPTDTLVSGWLGALWPLGWWIGLTILVLSGVALLGAWRGRRGLTALAAVLAAWVVGVLAGRHLVRAFDLPAVVERAFFLVPAIPIVGVLLLLREPLKEYPLGWGRWSERGAMVRSGPDEASHYRRKAWIAFIVFLVPVALLGQASVGFEPVLAGTIWPALPGVVALAVVNAVVEEVLFRGLFQTVLIGCVGSGYAIWVQGLFFGLHHWGSAPSVIAGLGMVPFLAVLGAIWGKATLDTGGLGWSITVHAGLGVAYFAAIVP